MNKIELRDRIGDLAYEVTQNAATERPFTGEYDNFKTRITCSCQRRMLRRKSA